MANSDGAFLVEPEFSFQLTDGQVETAFDDGNGGLVLQRTSRGFDSTPEDTIIEFLPADSFEPQDLLVPTGDQYLVLRDVDDGTVWYTRWEGFDSPETAKETLRAFDLEGRSVTEVATTGGWESGIVGASVGGGLIVTYWFSEAASGFDFLDTGGNLVVAEGDPYQGTSYCIDGGERIDIDTASPFATGCFEWAALDGNGRLAFIERNFDDQFPRFFVVVVDLDSGTQVFRADLERPDQGWLPRHLEIQGDMVLVNRYEIGDLEDLPIGPLLIDVTTGARTEIPFPGRASFLTGPMAID